MAFSHTAVHQVHFNSERLDFTELDAALAYAENYADQAEAGTVYIVHATKVTYAPDPEPLES